MNDDPTCLPSAVLRCLPSVLLLLIQLGQSSFRLSLCSVCCAEYPFSLRTVACPTAILFFSLYFVNKILFFISKTVKLRTFTGIAVGVVLCFRSRPSLLRSCVLHGTKDDNHQGRSVLLCSYFSLGVVKQTRA